MTINTLIVNEIIGHPSGIQQSFIFYGRKVVAKIASTKINDLECIDANEVIVHLSGILQSFVFIGKKRAIKIAPMTVNDP